MATQSVGRYMRLVVRGWLHLRTELLGRGYAIPDGRSYRVFRETVRVAACADPVVLVVGFKLRWLGTNGFWHWVFQRVCILTTPFWSGFSGFRVKLWMVAPASGHYLGIYQWDGEANAGRYVHALVRVLRPLSQRGSVWYALKPRIRLDNYLEHAARA